MSNMSVQRPAASLNVHTAPAAKTAEKPAAQKPQVAIEADNYKRSAANGDLKSGLAATSVTTTTTIKTTTIIPGLAVTSDAEAPDTSKRSLADGALKGGLAAGIMTLAPGLAYLATAGVAMDTSLAPTIIASGTIVTGLSGAVAGAISSQMPGYSGVYSGIFAGTATGIVAGIVTGGVIGQSGNGAIVGGFAGAIAGLIGGVAGAHATKEE